MASYDSRALTWQTIIRFLDDEWRTEDDIISEMVLAGVHDIHRSDFEVGMRRLLDAEFAETANDPPMPERHTETKEGQTCTDCGWYRLTRKGQDYTQP